MLSTSSRQTGLFDAPAWCGSAVPSDSFYGLLATHGERIVRDEDFADCYSERGRPSVPPSLLAKLLLLAYRDDVSDVRAMESLRMHLGWKVALGLPLDHEGFHPTTLVKFRARLLLHGKERLALERSVALAGELGLLEGAAEQIVDSTPMLGAAATKDTVRLVRAGVARLIDAVCGVDPEAAGLLREGLEFDYASPGSKPDCNWRSKPARQQMLSRVAQDAQRAIVAVTAVPALSDERAVAEALTLVQELIGQDYQVDPDGVPRLARQVVPGRICSVVDPEIRHGRKSSSQRFDGFKAHLASTSGPQPVITAISVTPANVYDGAQAAGLVDQQAPATRPERLLGDSAYADQQTRESLAERAVSVHAHVPQPATREGRIPKAQFEIDLDQGTVGCPAGQVAQIPERTQASGARVAHFARATCNDCPLVGACAPHGKGRSITIGRREDLLIEGRRILADPAAAEHLRRTRPRIERLIGLFARTYHARTSRYLGARKALVQASFAAMLVNLGPIGAALRAQAA